MSEINSPKYPKGTYPELSPNPNEKNGLVNGGQDTPVIVNTSPKTLDNKCSAGDNAWVDSLKDKIIYDAEDNEVQVGVHLYADGDFETGGDVEVGRKLIIDDLQKIVDPDGDAIIPDPTGHVGKYLKHTSTGYGWDLPAGGTKLYKHSISLNGFITYIVIISTSAVACSNITSFDSLLSNESSIVTKLTYAGTTCFVPPLNKVDSSFKSVYIDTDNTLKVQTLFDSSSTFDSDTVTEL